jgi:hypothetical protein
MFLCCLTMLCDSEHKAPAPGCTAKCRGDPSITCGGPGGAQGSAISIMKIECGYVDDGWGFSVILVFLVVGSAYLGGGIAWNAKLHGKRGWDALPHQVRLPRIPRQEDLGDIVLSQVLDPRHSETLWPDIVSQT